jgi:hypothetical protein
MQHITSIMSNSVTIIAHNKAYASNTLNSQYNGCPTTYQFIKELSANGLMKSAIVKDLTAAFSSVNLSNLTNYGGIINLYKKIDQTGSTADEVMAAVACYLAYVSYQLSTTTIA